MRKMLIGLAEDIRFSDDDILCAGGVAELVAGVFEVDNAVVLLQLRLFHLAIGVFLAAADAYNGANHWRLLRAVRQDETAFSGALSLLHAEEHAVAQRLQVFDVVGGGVGAGESSEDVAFAKEDVVLFLELKVGAADAELAIKHGHTFLELLRLLTNAYNVACFLKKKTTRGISAREMMSKTCESVGVLERTTGGFLLRVSGKENAALRLLLSGRHLHEDALAKGLHLRHQKAQRACDIAFQSWAGSGCARRRRAFV